MWPMSEFGGSWSLLEKEFQSSTPVGSEVGSVCRKPELIDEACENAPISSLSNRVTLCPNRARVLPHRLISLLLEEFGPIAFFTFNTKYTCSCRATSSHMAEKTLPMRLRGRILLHRRRPRPSSCGVVDSDRPFLEYS